MRIHVVGIGAVGNFVAFNLRQSLHPRHSVVALHRTETAELIPNSAPLNIERDGAIVSADGVTHLPYGETRDRVRRSDFAPASMETRDNSALRLAIGPIESLIVTTKAFTVPNVIKRLRHNINRDSTVVLLHNGAGVYEALLEDVYPDPNDRPNFVLCCNTHGLYSKALLHTVHASVGSIKLGIAPDTFGRNYEASYSATGRPARAKLSLDDIANVTPGQPDTPRYLNLRNTIAALVHSSGLNAFWEPFGNVNVAMRSKLVVNSVINPVSALLQCPNGDVLKTQYGQSVARSVCQEAEAVFRAQWRAEVQEQLEAHKSEDGVEFEPIPFPRDLKAPLLRREVERVAELTKNNYSSMYMDLRLRRPTEIDFLNGYLVRTGKKYGYDAVMNVALTDLVKMRTAIPLAPS